MTTNRHDGGLTGKSVLITGATGGIGHETALEIVRAGGDVILTGRNEEKLNELRLRCERINDGVQVTTVQADILKEEDRDGIMMACKDVRNPVFGMVNSAGIAGGEPLESLSEDEARLIMELNYFSTVLLTKAIYPLLKEKMEGSIVNVSSLSGLRGTDANTAYSASKFALIGFTQSFAHEAAPYGIRVNAVCPGFVDTDMGRTAIQRKGERNGRSYEEERAVIEQSIPSQRITTANEVAQTILYLLTPGSMNTIGESIKISGGAVM
ncbi:short-chain dehydrogenase [Pontibacillus halophilus JSM 076056 = DSM 19796]|uniref:Short-chain dehydrogenase n=1 Tax=Pontibacillus halophilus JSM 076056 = DSM 19796 TaxID=1385510 RepID=A0A0A5GLJ3_9BACI|nr:SDR family oxidoreductase [Pontibacillus halophilus]KGX91995.1 short-chain dehydrogenase [Pontibacillus halophilus JSM 076056 = DSM 19796]